MNTTQTSQPQAARHRAILITFTVAVFTSALLLFAVQPLFTRMVLPRLGGSPSVWSVAMVFFQSMLLAGYAYAHFISRLRQPVAIVAIHLALLAAAGFSLPLSIAQGWGQPPNESAEFWLLGLFTISIGLPFFALAANNPLLQTWFVRTGHPDGHDPYFLYAASNVGSFLALLSYPILFEPAFTLQTQNRLWVIGFLILFCLIAACGWLLLRSPKEAQDTQLAEQAAEKPGWLIIGRWIFLSAVPSGLLVAVTAHISTDVAAAPLLWVIPLSLYLLTWVIVFQRKPLIPHKWMLLVQPFAIFGLIMVWKFSSEFQLLLNLGSHLAAFFIITMTCHGELARLRPPAARLTTFYVALSFGGMVGGLFAGLIAPYIFSWVTEYPILIALSLLCRPWRNQTLGRLDLVFWGVVAFLVVAMFNPALTTWLRGDDGSLVVSIAVVVAAGFAILLMNDPLKAGVAIAVAFAIIRLYPIGEDRYQTVRSFFGVHKIFDTQGGRYRVLMHGSTIHGAQKLLDGEGKPITGRPEPISYYHKVGGMAQAIDAIRARKTDKMRVAAVGLGSGTLACLSEPGENWRFFEIDRSIVTIARDSGLFTYYPSCTPDAPIILGDARLTMEKEADGSFDLIIVDAYSSDAIPIHLATQEAMAIYKRKLAPDGVVVMHISNRHLELASVVTGIAAANQMKTWVYDATSEEEGVDEYYVFTTEVTISARRPEDIGFLLEKTGWDAQEPDPAIRTWTDDYSNIVGAVLRKWK